MAQDLLVESHLGSSPRQAARQLGSGLARRLAPHRRTVIWELAVRGEAPSPALHEGLSVRLEADTVSSHVRRDWQAIEVGESTWRLPKAALGANLIVALGGSGPLSLRMPALHDLASPRAALSNLRPLVATAALVFEHGGHAFAVPSIEAGTQLELVDAYVTELVASGQRTAPAGLRVLGTPKLSPPSAHRSDAVGLPFIEPLYRRS